MGVARHSAHSVVQFENAEAKEGELMVGSQLACFVDEDVNPLAEASYVSCKASFPAVDRYEIETRIAETSSFRMEYEAPVAR